jgi:hypothetical protein
MTSGRIWGLGAVALVGLVGAWVGVRAVRTAREQRARRRAFGRRVGWALAAGTASFAARRFAQRALAR